MGSRVYARSCARDQSASVVGMITPETLGCYSTRSRRKRWFFAHLAGLPDRPDYVAFLGNRASRRFLRECADVFRRHSPIGARTVALPSLFGRVGWSDDWAFWQEGIPAFTVTDTAHLRSDDYHELADTADRLDYGPMADVVWGLRYVVETPVLLSDADFVAQRRAKTIGSSWPRSGTKRHICVAGEWGLC